ncbi:MAG TPA: hypothetical protein ENK43_03100 [Planctomycetes bacterium]|nr:hypothetical protein [Planctomycetota bacterium]
MKARFAPGIDLGRGKAPLVLVLFTLILMVGALVWLTRVESRKRYVEVNEIQPQTLADKEIEAARVNPDFSPFDPKTTTWGDVADLDPNGQKLIPREALARAAAVVANFSWARMKLSASTVDPSSKGFHRLDAVRTLGSPAKVRGLPVEVVGRLVATQEIDLFDTYGFKLPDGRTKVMEGVILSRADVHGARIPVKFTLLDPQPYPLPLLGDQVKLQGVFFKLQSLQAREDGPFETGVWILGKRIFKSYVLPAKEEIHLDRLKDLSIPKLAGEASRSIFDDPAIFDVMAEIVRGKGFKDAKVLHFKSGEFKELLEGDPADYRGKVIDFSARVLKVEHHSMAAFFPQYSPGEGGVDDFWITYVTSDGAIPLTVIWLKKPNVELELKDQVHLRAVFYNLWAYHAKKGRVIRAPLLFGLGDIEKVEVAKYTGFDPVVWGILIFSVLIIVLVYLVVRADRKRARMFQDELRAKRRLHRGLNRVAAETLAGSKAGSSDDGASTPGDESSS